LTNARWSAQTSHSALELEQLFHRVVNRVILDLVAVDTHPMTDRGGYCFPELVVLGADLKMPFRLFALLHELSHWELHMGSHRSHDTVSDRHAWEFEAHQVATLLCAGPGVQVVECFDPRFSLEEVLTLHPSEYYQQRIESAVERIWQIIGESPPSLPSELGTSPDSGHYWADLLTGCVELILTTPNRRVP
jgi:hypothetical protein